MIPSATIVKFPKEAFGEPTGKFPPCYTEEASTLELKDYPRRFEIEGVGLFHFSHYDYQGQGEDREIAGARYRHATKNIQALIIND